MVGDAEDSRTFCLHPEVEKERTTFRGSCISMMVLHTVISHSYLLSFSLYRSLMLKGSKVFKEGRRLRLFKFSICLPLLLLLLLSRFSRVRLCATPWTAARQASLSIANSESTQTHVHWVDDAIQPSHLLSSPSPPALNLSQHQGLFQWVSWRLAVPKTIKMTLVRPPHDQFQDDCQSWLCCFCM